MGNGFPAIANAGRWGENWGPLCSEGLLWSTHPRVEVPRAVRQVCQEGKKYGGGRQLSPRSLCAGPPWGRVWVAMPSLVGGFLGVGPWPSLVASGGFPVC